MVYSIASTQAPKNYFTDKVAFGAVVAVFVFDMFVIDNDCSGRPKCQLSNRAVGIILSSLVLVLAFIVVGVFKKYKHDNFRPTITVTPLKDFEIESVLEPAEEVQMVPDDGAEKEERDGHKESATLMGERPLVALSKLTNTRWWMPLYKGKPIQFSGSKIVGESGVSFQDSVLRLENMKLQIIQNHHLGADVKVIDDGSFKIVRDALDRCILPPLQDIVISYLSSPYLNKTYFINDDRFISSFLFERRSVQIWNQDPRGLTTALRIIKTVMERNQAKPLILIDDRWNWIVKDHRQVIATVVASGKEYIYRNFVGSNKVNIFPLSWGRGYAYAHNAFECLSTSGWDFASQVQQFDALPNEK